MIKKNFVFTICMVLMMLLVAGLIWVSMTYRYFGFNTQPSLRAVTRTPGSLIFSGKKVCYEIFDSGYAREIGEFTISDVEAYRIDEEDSKHEGILIENHTGIRIKNGIVSDFAHNIIILVKTKTKIKSPDVYKLYVLDGRYFFDVFDGYQPADIIFEYLPEKNEIKEITKFRGKNIEHVELYKTS